MYKSFAILQHHRDTSNEKLFSGQLPTRVVIGFVTNEAFNGLVVVIRSVFDIST